MTKQWMQECRMVWWRSSIVRERATQVREHRTAAARSGEALAARGRERAAAQYAAGRYLPARIVGRVEQPCCVLVVEVEEMRARRGDGASRNESRRRLVGSYLSKERRRVCRLVDIGSRVNSRDIAHQTNNKTKPSSSKMMWVCVSTNAQRIKQGDKTGVRVVRRRRQQPREGDR